MLGDQSILVLAHDNRRPFVPARRATLLQHGSGAAAGMIIEIFEGKDALDPVAAVGACVRKTPAAR